MVRHWTWWWNRVSLQTLSYDVKILKLTTLNNSSILWMNFPIVPIKQMAYLLCYLIPSN